MSRSTFSGPVLSGTSRYAPIRNIGNSLVVQVATITQNSTNPVSATFYLPGNSQITNFTLDTTVSWNSATSAVLTIGITAGGTEYVTSVDVKAATGRSAYTFTQAQLIAMLSTALNTSDSLAAGTPISRVVATVTPTGATSAGTTVVQVHYLQADDRAAGSAQ